MNHLNHSPISKLEHHARTQVQLCVLHRFESNDVFRAFWLFRLLKLERYQKSFSVFGTIIHRSRDILVISGFAAVVTWVFASTAMYVVFVREAREPHFHPSLSSVILHTIT